MPAGVVAYRTLLVGRQRPEAAQNILDVPISPFGARERRVCVVHIRLMVLVVMDPHRLLVDMRLEGVIGVGEGWNCVWHGAPPDRCSASVSFYQSRCPLRGYISWLLPMTRLSEYFLPTEREPPADAEAIWHRLMVRAGLIRQVGSGLWSWLPAGWRVHQRIVEIVREEMNAIGGQEMLMPVLHPAEPWRRTGRYDIEELFKLTDRRGADMVLAMTHEEIVTGHVAAAIRSYRDLPKILYHFQTKERDEPRPRAGVLRTREFVMKDSYSFDRDAEGLDVSYQKHVVAYDRIFDRCGLEWYRVKADVGMMGGHGADEYMAPCAAGRERGRARPRIRRQPRGCDRRCPAGRARLRSWTRRRRSRRPA